MATKRPAKIASSKKAKQGKLCPQCQTDMEITKVIRSQVGGSGIYWVCQNAKCGCLLSTAGAEMGALQLA